jgi:hypothetical protein
MDVGEPNFGTALATPPGVVTAESGGLGEPGFPEPPDPVTTLGEGLDPETTVVVTVWPEVAVGALTKAEAGSPWSVSVSAALRA